MAYKKRFKRYRGTARKAYSKTGLNLSIPFLVGAMVGFTDLDQRIPSQIVLGAATVPMRGFGTIKAGAQGVIFGNLVQGLKNGGLSSSGFRGV